MMLSLGSIICFYGSQARGKHYLLLDYYKGGFPGGSEVKASAQNAGDLGSIPRWEDPLEKEMATHSSVLAWRIP